MTYFIANWKMYLSIKESRRLSAEIDQWLGRQTVSEGKNIVLCPSDIALQEVSHQLNSDHIKLSGQKLSNSPSLGAFTGQTAASQLQEVGVEYVLVGHSEVRTFSCVHDSEVHYKTKIALASGLKPIVCIGESKDEREDGWAEERILEELHGIFSELDLDGQDFLIAYEPLWAIGTGISIEPNDAQQMHAVIRKAMHEYVSDPSLIPILYGGSIDASSISSFLSQADINGVLVGSASTKEDEFKKMLEIYLA